MGLQTTDPTHKPWFDQRSVGQAMVLGPHTIVRHANHGRHLQYRNQSHLTFLYTGRYNYSPLGPFILDEIQAYSKGRGEQLTTQPIN